VVSGAYKHPKDTPDQQAARDAAIQSALMHAAVVPLDTARAAAEVAALAAICAEKGNTNAASDAGVAALLAEAACRGAAYNVRINVSSMSDKAAGAPLAAEAASLVAAAGVSAKRATEFVEKQIG
jgi:glutamate formiminotransferase/formiminotetrahydrofolate cyclodeaminase